MANIYFNNCFFNQLSFDYYKELHLISKQEIKLFFKDCKKDVTKIDLNKYSKNLIWFLQKYRYIHNGYIFYSNFLNNTYYTIENLIKNYDLFIERYKYITDSNIDEHEFYTACLLIRHFYRVCYDYNPWLVEILPSQNSIITNGFDIELSKVSFNELKELELLTLNTEKARWNLYQSTFCYINQQMIEFLEKMGVLICDDLKHGFSLGLNEPLLGACLYYHPFHTKGNDIKKYKEIIMDFNKRKTQLYFYVQFHKCYNDLKNLLISLVNK